jgi:hypothetical protein
MFLALGDTSGFGRERLLIPFSTGPLAIVSPLRRTF